MNSGYSFKILIATGQQRWVYLRTIFSYIR